MILSSADTLASEGQLRLREPPLPGLPFCLERDPWPEVVNLNQALDD